jgi:hypothetical protein
MTDPQNAWGPPANLARGWEATDWFYAPGGRELSQQEVRPSARKRAARTNPVWAPPGSANR